MTNAMVAEGMEASLAGVKLAVTLTLKDGKYTFNGGVRVWEGAAKVDRSTSPKSVDITSKGENVLGIYEVKGDTLRLCWAPSGKPRPEAFESKEGSGHILITYQRAKPR